MVPTDLLQIAVSELGKGDNISSGKWLPTFTGDVGADLLQNMVQIFQRVSVDEAPPGWVTLTQVVCMMQAHTAARTAVTLQPTDVQVQVADGTLCFIFVIFVEALQGTSAPGALDTCDAPPEGWLLLSPNVRTQAGPHQQEVPFK